VLSAFFWGYSMTQVIGGYLSDRFGAELVMTCAMVGWSGLTFITPIIAHSSFNWSHNGLLRTFIVLRMLTGCVQGTILRSFTLYWRAVFEVCRCKVIVSHCTGGLCLRYVDVQLLLQLSTNLYFIVKFKCMYF